MNTCREKLIIWSMFLEKSKNIYNQFCKVLQYAEK